MKDLEEMTEIKPKRGLVCRIVDYLVTKPSLYIGGAALFTLFSYGCVESQQDQPEKTNAPYSDNADSTTISYESQVCMETEQEQSPSKLSIEEKKEQCFALYQHCVREAHRLLRSDPEKVGDWKLALTATKAICTPKFIDQCLGRLDIDPNYLNGVKEGVRSTIAQHEIEL